MSTLLEIRPSTVRKPVGELRAGDVVKLDDYERPKLILEVVERGSARWVFLEYGAFRIRRVLKKARVVEVLDG